MQEDHAAISGPCDPMLGGSPYLPPQKKLRTIQKRLPAFCFHACSIEFWMSIPKVCFKHVDRQESPCFSQQSHRSHRVFLFVSFTQQVSRGLKTFFSHGLGFLAGCFCCERVWQLMKTHGHLQDMRDPVHVASRRIAVRGCIIC